MDPYQAEVTLLPRVVVLPDALQTIGRHGRGGKLPRVARRNQPSLLRSVLLLARSEPF